MTSDRGDYPNSGALFKADKKDDRDRDYRGDANVTCPHCGNRFKLWISGYIKKWAQGRFVSLRFKDKDSALRGAPLKDDGDDIPFA